MTKHIIIGIRLALCAFIFTIFTNCNQKDKEQIPFPSDEIADIKGVKNEYYRMPEDMSHLRNNLQGNLAIVFNDSNIYQLSHAIHMGIEPVENAQDAFKAKRPLKKISDTSTYKLDELTHSIPYLVPEAAKLLSDIGHAFQDTLKRRQLPLARIRITSVLRTMQQVKKLRRSNRNATEQSAHQYATTFDIGYNAFYPSSASNEKIYDPRYKIALAEVLYDMRAKNRCMVKYERKSPCFHITVIK